VTLGPATVKDFAHVLLARDIRCAPVIDIGQQLIGVVSEADLISREGYPTVRNHRLAGIVDAALAEHRHHWTGRAERLTAGEIMTTDIVSCAPYEPVPLITRRMLVSRRAHPAGNRRWPPSPL
jgi:predicted transcriptional regulator